MQQENGKRTTRKERSFADVVSKGKARKAQVFMGDSIIRKVDKVVNRAEDITIYLLGAKYRTQQKEQDRSWVVAWEALFLCIWERTMPIRREQTSAIVGKNRRLKKDI